MNTELSIHSPARVTIGSLTCDDECLEQRRADISGARTFQGLSDLAGLPVYVVS
ncbi:MAG: hypothetical protein ACI97B_003480 [Verrucomicrobiales bacterium]|jgi:hypothetical protein